MQQLNICDVLLYYLSSPDNLLFTCALRLIGNISASENSTYIEEYYKHGLIESLSTGWRASTEEGYSKEVIWLLGNMVANGNIQITGDIL